MLHAIAPDNDRPFTDICRQHNWKRTVQRRAVFTYLCGNHDHPTVETVWRRVRDTLPDVSLDSVYRILDDFSSVGLIRRLEGAKVIRYDADTRPHEHFVCDRCGRMHDFACIEPEEVVAKCRDFGRVDSVELTVHGLCRDCLVARQ
ncbi:MAG: transcriptional repressor [Planctomycetaceae bacterium]|nr:transcriptional repressor [Planctomycetaceae bacterium]